MGCAFIFAYMKAIKSTTQSMAAARELADAGHLTESANLYQQMVSADPTNQQAVSRLLTLYRRLKEPKKELAVIQSVLAAYAQKNKASQEKWLSAHPRAARASRAFLRSLGGSEASSFGANGQVQRLLERKAVVEKKLYGATKANNKGRRKSPVASKPASPKPAPKKPAPGKPTVEQKKTTADATPSLFVISIRYLAPLETIDAMLPQHAAFLDKHFTAGDFLVAGRQIPRTGGVIIARGKDRTSIERIMKQDPFLKNKAASIDIVEFAASKRNKKPW